MSLRYQAHALTDEAEKRRTLAEDVRRGLTGSPRSLPPKYFYDATGSKLFDDITELPEYYLTRTEVALLAETVPALMGELGPVDVVELGAGSAIKTRQLLDTRNGNQQDLRYIPIDLDEGLMETVARRLLADYPFLRVEALVGDFEHHLRDVPAPVGPRLALLLGSTIGNLDPPARRRLLGEVHGLLGHDDRFLLGLDLIKDVKVLEAAYNDASGVTRQFNRNMLRVVNRGVDADFDPTAFRHVAFYNEGASRIEMHLVPDSPQEVHLRKLGLTIHLAPGDGIWTESCYKFSRASVQQMLEETRFRLASWHVDPANYFALAVAAPA